MTRYQAEFESRCKKRVEGWADYAEDLRSLADKAYPDLQLEARERLTLLSYLKQPEQLQVAFSVRQCRPATLDDAMTVTLEMESYLAPPRSSVQSVSNNEDPISEELPMPVAATSTDQITELTALMERLSEHVQTLERRQSTLAPPEGPSR